MGELKEEETFIEGLRRILFIGSISSFIGNAISTNLKAAGFEVSFAKADVTSIMKEKGSADIYLMYLTEDVSSLSDALVYLKDTCIEEEKHLFLIGYESEIKEAYAIIPEDLIKGTFDRPINVKEMVAGLKEKVEEHSFEPRKKHVLVVDDSGTFLRTIKSWLDPYYKVSMVNSGMNAITFLAKHKPDLILLDYEMPVCSGPQVLSMIRDEVTTSDLPVMFLTSKGDKESVMKVLSLKPDGYILKSRTQAEILEEIARFFESKKIRSLS
ncbi:MAG: response regulator [Lachnospiraceae bacterium]|nr:response regulator [Lachnospiraceae bacterium]